MEYKFLFTCASKIEEYTDYVSVEIYKFYSDEFDAVNCALNYESKFKAVNLEVLSIMVYKVDSPCNILLNIEKE